MAHSSRATLSSEVAETLVNIAQGSQSPLRRLMERGLEALALMVEGLNMPED